MMSRLSAAARHIRREDAERLAWPKAALLIFFVSVVAWAVILGLLIWV